MNRILILLLLVAGCSTQPKMTQIYYVPAFTIVVADGSNFAPALGWCDQKNRIVYVKYDGDMPRLETLGHEVWHLPELGGKWHK